MHGSGGMPGEAVDGREGEGRSETDGEGSHRTRSHPDRGMERERRETRDQVPGRAA